MDFGVFQELFQRSLGQGEIVHLDSLLGDREQMVAAMGRVDTQRAFKLFGDWTDRVAAGELPAARPERPSGIERNVVVTLWDWVVLVLPAWVAVVSLFILRRERAARRARLAAAPAG